MEVLPCTCRYVRVCMTVHKLEQATWVKSTCCSALEIIGLQSRLEKMPQAAYRKISNRRIRIRSRFCPSASANMVKRLGRPQGRRPTAIHGKSKVLPQWPHSTPEVSRVYVAVVYPPRVLFFVSQSCQLVHVVILGITITIKYMSV